MNKLSICIPTYNRYPFLKWTLNKTGKDFPKSTIIISNNASTDDTRTCIRQLWGSRTEFIEQETNIGAFPNMCAVLLAAQTKYCVYLGDDDYLLPDEVQKGIDFLDEHLEIDYYCAPCQLWNEVEQKSVFDAFFVTEDKTFYPMRNGRHSDRDALWNFIIANHVFPEHIIYRRCSLEKILSDRMTRSYWAFTDLANAFNEGPVHFASKPFYRNIVQHPVGTRQKLGDVQCLTHFDEYRAGLEVMAYDLFRGYLTPKIKINIQNMICKFITMRISVAEKLLYHQNINVEADNYHKRVVMGMLGRHD